jgi:hypothetical protein
VASLLPALAAALLLVLQPASLDASGAAETLPLVNELVVAVARNIALGGVLAWLCGLLATRGRGPT